jgi:hypothetical protein
MSTKQIVIICVIALLGAFAAGRWSAPEKIKIQTVEVEKKTNEKQVAVDDHKVTTITETDKPDGTKVKTTVIADNSKTKVDDKSTDDTTKTMTKEVDKSSSKVTISLLASMHLSSPGLPIYGAAVTKPILGPLTVGIFGFQDSTAGVSVGLTF